MINEVPVAPRGGAATDTDVKGEVSSTMLPFLLAMVSFLAVTLRARPPTLEVGAAATRVFDSPGVAGDATVEFLARFEPFPVVAWGAEFDTAGEFTDGDGRGELIMAGLCCRGSGCGWYEFDICPATESPVAEENIPVTTVLFSSANECPGVPVIIPRGPCENPLENLRFIGSGESTALERLVSIAAVVP